MTDHGHSVRVPTIIDWTIVDEPRYRLRLERESLKHWIVVDSADRVFLRVPDRQIAERFMFAFADRHGAGSIDLDSMVDTRLAPVIRLADRKIVA